MDRSAVKEAIQKLTVERDRLESERAEIDRALDALRPLAEDPPVTHGNGNGAQNGHTEITTRGKLGEVLKVLQKRGEPISAKEAHLALGRRAPAYSTTTNSILKRAHEDGVVRRIGKKGSYLYAFR